MQLNHILKMRRVLVQWLVAGLAAGTIGLGAILPVHASGPANAPAPALYLPQILTQSRDNPPASGQESPTATPAPQPTGTPAPQPTGTPAPDNHGNVGDDEESEGAPQPNPVATPTSTTIVVTPEAGRDLPEVPGLGYCPETTAAEGELAALMAQHPEQGRPTMQCDSILTQVARARALDMARRDYVDHATPDGLGPNQLVAAAGYLLPADYSLAPGSNNIESLAAGNHHAPTVWETWMDLPTHRVHLLALDAFFMPQTHYGIGYVYVPESRYRHYWVVLTAPAPPLAPSLD